MGVWNEGKRDATASGPRLPNRLWPRTPVHPPGYVSTVSCRKRIVAFLNIRKGSFAFAPRRWLGDDGTSPWETSETRTNQAIKRR
jgi:hypothetical protein